MTKQFKRSDLSGRAKKARLNRTSVSSKTLAIAVRKQIMRVAETKENDTADVIANTAVVNGYVNTLNIIAEGTDYTNRIGRHITPKYVRVDYYVTGPQATTPIASTTDAWYLALVWDRQPDATAATYAQIYDFSAGNLKGQPFKATATFKDRFKILREERGIVQGTTISVTTGNFTENSRGHIFVDLSKFKTEYGASGGVVPTSGALYFVFGSNNNTGSVSSSAAVTFNARFTFTDM